VEEKKMAQVFISYSRRDLSFVKRLVADLQKTGIKVWYDLSGLEGGARWRVEIQNAIQASDYVIVVLSPASTQSEWVENEYLFASNLKRKILPLMYRECELPMSFLNLNYIDVQDENYSRNFEKITRFLNQESLPPSSIERSTRLKRSGAASYAVLGVVTVIVASTLLFMFKSRGTKAVPEFNAVLTSTQVLIQPASSPTARDQVTSSPAPTQPTRTATKKPTSSYSMGTPVPITADDASLAAFIMSAANGNMDGDWTGIDHPASSNNPAALVFAMPNFNSPESARGVRNKHLIAAWYTGSQWAIKNQDQGYMPQDAAFNIQILKNGGNAFLHTATASDIKQNCTVLDNPLAADPDALVFAMPNFSPPDGSMKLKNTHAIAVSYTGSQWAICNQDLFPMVEGASFNIQVLRPSENAFIHTATASNTGENWTTLDEQLVNDLASDENKLVFVMPRNSSGEDKVYLTHPLGVWHNGTVWKIFNEEREVEMPVGAEFNVLILDKK
jgi:hypothetical protein